ncbi:MAG: hypothetical protein AB7E85_01660 [Pseudobdellovibrionaceae bacterium]
MDTAEILKLVMALSVVVALMAGLALVLKLTSGTRLGRKSAHKHLSIIDVHALDAKRRLVLIGRDDTAHLVILGPEGDTVIETGIRLEDLSGPATAKNIKGNDVEPL